MSNKRLEEIKLEMLALADERDDIVDAAFEKEILPKAKKLIGRCFKTINSGGRFIDGETWYRFIRVEDVSDKTLIVTKLDMHPDGSFSLETNDRWYPIWHGMPNLDKYTRTSPSTFSKQLKKAMDSLS